MAKIPMIEKALSTKYGDLHTVIPNLVNEHGQEGAAQILGVRQGWISRWLKTNHYEMVIEYRRKATEFLEQAS